MSETLRCLQIRSYEIKEGRMDLFEAIFRKEVLPLLKQWRTPIVFAGWSSDGSGSFVLMREYDDVNQLHKSQDRFYSSAEWRDGPRQAMLDHIATYVTVTLELSSECIARIKGELAANCLGEPG